MSSKPISATNAIKQGLFVFLWLLSSVAVAENPMRPFVVGSMAHIEKEQAGKPFVLVFWSLTCAYCPKELKMLADMQRAYPALRVVLVATDTPEESEHIAKKLDDYGLAAAPRWVFADAMPERLRFEIDKRWYGEVPRTYFYDVTHQREARAGLVSRADFEAWWARVQ